MSELDRLPVISVWNLILVPLQGEISDPIAERIREQVLETIRSTGAEGLIVDITGVWMMDSHLCSVISNIAASARLMGTRCVICGMSAQIALTLHAMGIDLGNVRTALTLEQAFASFGIRRVAHERRDAPARALAAPPAEHVLQRAAGRRT